MKDYSLAVIIPCWNCEPYIGQMLECLLSQTFSDWKAFLVDDGCTDGTAGIIKDYALKDTRISYALRSRAPKGAQTCRNIGFELSEGAKYVVFFDADDLIAPCCLQQRVEYMEKHEELDFSIFPAKAFKEDLFDETNTVFGIQFIKDDLQAMLNWNLPMVVWNNIYRRQSLVDNGLAWDEKILSMQDSAFNICALAKGMVYEYAKAARFDYFYRVIDGSLSKKIKSEDHRDSLFYLLNSVADVLVDAFGNKYDFYIQNYFLVYLFQLFNDDKKALRRMIDMSCVRKHPAFRFKLILYLLLNRRGRSCLFSKYLRYSRPLKAQWEEHMRCQADEFRQLQSRPLSQASI